MKKVLFSKRMNKGNLNLRDYLLEVFSKYVKLGNCDLLEVGCGNGRFASLLGPKIGSYVGVDPDREYLKVARETTSKKVNARFLEGRAEELPINSESFDIIFYAFSWHFIQDFDKAINEARRLLKKKGVVVIYEPSKEGNNWADPRLRKGSKQFNENMYKKKMNDLDKGMDAISLLEDEGFSIVESKADDGGFANLWVLKLSLEEALNPRHL